jgi:hypothetical protein
MVTRRRFIESGLAVAALAANPLSFGVTARDSYIPLFKVLVDRALAQSTLFAEEAARLGAAVRLFDADIGRVWMEEVVPRWTAIRASSLGQGRGEGIGSAAIAGLTAGATLFCVELLARDYGMHLVYRVQHSPDRSGRVTHTVTGAEELKDWEGVLTAQGANWAGTAAAMASHCTRSIEARRHELLDLSAFPNGPQQSLFSWVIA